MTHENDRPVERQSAQPDPQIQDLPMPEQVSAQVVGGSETLTRSTTYEGGTGVVSTLSTMIVEQKAALTAIVANLK
jgi:hypothetical protein